MPIIESSLAVKAEGKIHKRKKWMDGLAYHERISKKWAKRFGPPKVVPAIFSLGDRFIVHPSLIPQLLAEIRRL